MIRTNDPPLLLSGGGQTISDPNVAYIRSDGNDTTGDGSPGAPYLTGQQAFDDGFRCFDIGEGCAAGDITIPSGTPTLHFRGRGAGSTVGVVRNTGRALTVVDTGALSVHFLGISTSGNPGNPGGNAGVLTARGVWSDGAFSSGGGGLGEGDSGGNGAAMTVFGPALLGDVISGGGTAHADGGGLNGDGGAVTFVGQVVVGTSLVLSGGSNGVGFPGADGALTLRNGPDVPTPTPDAATVTNAIISGVHYSNSYP